MTSSTFDVAVCCSSDSERSLVRWRFVKQPRVLDGNDGLGGEILHQLDLLVGEGPHLLPINDDDANELVFLQHRDGHKCPRASRMLRSGLSGLERHVGDVSALLGFDQPIDG